MNSSMALLIDDAPRVELLGLPEELQDILASGWVEGPGGSLLLGALYGAGWRDDWGRADVSFHEYEVNDVGVPSAGLSGQRDVFLRAMAGRALSFASRALRLAGGYDAGDFLIAVVSVSVDVDYFTGGTAVKFFTCRGDYPRYYDALERYTLEAIAVIDMNDIWKGLGEFR